MSASELTPEMLQYLSATSPMEPPPGEIQNFNGPWTSVQIGIFVSFGVTYGIATLFILARYFQALKLVKKLELDLVITTISYGLGLVYFITMVHIMDFGWGRHLWNVSLLELMSFNKALLPNTLTYLISPSVTKMAMCAILYRIDPSKLYKTIVVATGCGIFVYTLTLCIITGGPCNPLKDGTTVCLTNVATAQAVLNIASDFAVICIPIPTIYGLQIGIKQKLAVGALICLGSGVVVCSIARLPYVIALDGTGDITYTEGILGIWSIIEVNLGIICACAMRVKPLIKEYLPSLGIFGSSANKSKNNSKAPKGSSYNGLHSGSGHHVSGSHSYKLHSVQKGSLAPIEGGHGQKGISVYRSYEIDVERKGGSDGESMEKIL